MATSHVVDYSFVRVDFCNQQRHVPFGIRHGTDLGIQPFHLFQHVSITIRFKPHGRRRRGHQEGGGDTFAGYVGNHDLDGVRVDGNVVVVIATHVSGGMHHPGYLESTNRWSAYGEKQALNLRDQLDVLKKVVTLLLYRFAKQFPLLDVPLDEVNDEGETKQCQEVIEDPKHGMDNPR